MSIESSNAPKIYFRVVEEKGEQVIKQEKRGLFTWIKAKCDPDSFKLSKVAELVLANLEKYEGIQKAVAEKITSFNDKHPYEQIENIAVEVGIRAAKKSTLQRLNAMCFEDDTPLATNSSQIYKTENGNIFYIESIRGKENATRAGQLIKVDDSGEIFFVDKEGAFDKRDRNSREMSGDGESPVDWLIEEFKRCPLMRPPKSGQGQS